MIVSLMAAAFLAYTPTVPDQIDTAQAEWENFASLEVRDVQLPTEAMVAHVQGILERGECELPRQRPERFDIDVNYAIQLDPQGNATRIAVQDMGCRPLELYVGRVASKIVQEGHVGVTPRGEPRWYASRINFNLQ